MFGLVERPKDGMVLLPGRAAKDAGIDGFTHLGREDPGIPQCRIGAGTDAISGEDHQLPARGDELRQRPAAASGTSATLHRTTTRKPPRSGSVPAASVPDSPQSMRTVSKGVGALGRLGLAGDCLARRVLDAGHPQPQGRLQIISFMRVD